MRSLAIVGKGEMWRRQLAACGCVEHLESVEVPLEDGQPVQSHLQDVFASSEVDGVSVCTPVHQRFDVATAAVRAGKHLIIEPPLTATRDQTDQLRRMCRDSGVSLSVLRPQRHRLLLDSIHSSITSGSIGLPRFAHFNHVWHWPSEDATGSSERDFLLEFGPAAIDVALWLMSPQGEYASTLERIFARATSSSEPGCQIRYVSLLLSFTNGIQAIIEIGRISTIAPGTGLQSLSIIGEKGSIQHDLRKTDVVIGAGGMRPLANDAVAATAAALTNGSPGTSATDFDQATVALKWTLAAIDSLETGQPSEVDFS